MKHIARIKRPTLAIGMALLLGIVTTPPTSAAELQLSDTPLFIALGVEPNVVLTLDDSSSMVNCRITDDDTDRDWLIDRDGDFGPLDTAYLAATSPELNKLAYDPNIKYVIPENPITGLPVNVPSFTAALVDGYDSGSSTVDLSTNWRPCRSKTSWYDPFAPPAVGTPLRRPPGPGKPAYYSVWNGSDPTSESQVMDNSNYTVITVGGAEQQNFANWFSFYRWRYLAMKTVAARAFAHPDLNNRIRLAYSLMWGATDHCTTAGWPGPCGNGTYDKDKAGPISLMKKFEGTNRADFFTWLFATDTESGTPLRMALHRAGQYYMDRYVIYDSLYTNTQRYEPMNPVDSPWSFEPGVTRDPVQSCRQAFHVLMTDGGWSSDNDRAGVADNVDNQSWGYPEDLPSGASSYSPFAPYKDDNVKDGWGYLADNAFYYWVNDLQPSLANNVPAFMPDSAAHPVTGEVEDNPANDPATWQHMVNYTVGFAVDGDIPYNDANYQDLLKGSSDGGIDWSSDRIDDLWHTAVNSRGKFMNAKNPQELVDSFSVALNDVLARTGSGSAVALNSGSLEAGSRIYQGRFTSGAWTGQVLAFDISTTTGVVITPEVWDAAPKLDTLVAGSGWDSGREVLTYNGTAGVPFRWGSLTVGQQADLDKDYAGSPDGEGAARLNYLRGDDADEAPNGNNYRARVSKLGDIINGAPVYVGIPPFNYPDNLESGGEKYSAFKSTHNSRAPMIYTGANDGMLHAFDASTGDETLAYVPQKVFADLTRLTAASYPHRFYVDGAPTMGDAYWSSVWHTVLTGGLRNGGQGIYALDITNPASFDEANASSLVLWEFTDADDTDLGYTYSRPAIVRMANGKWAAVFGNGYNNTEADGNASTSGNAVLYIAFLEDGLDGTWTPGSDFIKIDTGAGSITTPNGLATVSPVDVDGDRIVDYIYGGDLLGNLWKFDVRDPTSSNWSITYKLFTATDDAGDAQSITTRPEVGTHPDISKTGFMVYFGTGKYLESSDNSTVGTQTQTFYGIWDPDGATPPSYDRTSASPNLLEQTIDDEITALGAEVRIISDNTISWASDPYSPGGGDHLGWYMDLINLGGSPVANSGERQVTTPVLRSGRIIFSTLIPSGSSCVFGGDGWIMELDSTDGSPLADPPFDLDKDGTFDLVDDGNGNMVAPGGTKSTGGAPSAPGILDAGDGKEYKYISGTDQGSIQVISEQGEKDCTGGCGGTRESWQQLQ